MGDTVLAKTGEVLKLDKTLSPRSPLAPAALEATRCPDVLETVDLDSILLPEDSIPTLSAGALRETLKHARSTNVSKQPSHKYAPSADPHLITLPDSLDTPVPSAEPPVLVLLKDVMLIDDAHGGVWAMVRDSPSKPRKTNLRGNLLDGKSAHDEKSVERAVRTAQR